MLLLFPPFLHLYQPTLHDRGTISTSLSSVIAPRTNERLNSRQTNDSQGLSGERSSSFSLFPSHRSTVKFPFSLSHSCQFLLSFLSSSPFFFHSFQILLFFLYLYYFLFFPLCSCCFFIFFFHILFSFLFTINFCHIYTFLFLSYFFFL